MAGLGAEVNIVFLYKEEGWRERRRKWGGGDRE